MADPQTGNIDFSHQMALIVPQREDVLPVPVHFWGQIMGRIRNCTDSSATYDSLGWGLIGSGISALLTVITLPLSVDFTTTVSEVATKANLPAIITGAVLLAVAIGTLISGAISLRFAKQHRTDRHEMREIIASDMEQFQQRHLSEMAAAK